MSVLPPLALYIHFPWCLQKCPYCDFNSHACDVNVIPFDFYHQALTADLLATLPCIDPSREIISIFIGGGTPSLMPPGYIETLLRLIEKHFTLHQNCEVTLEANPGSYEKNRFRDFHTAGINRISLGVQSFDNAKLKAIGRIHTSEQAKLTIEEVANTFERWNLDLMYALPDQSLEDLAQDLQLALSFQPPHLSVYHLTLEENTYFAKYPPRLPEEDTCAQMLDVVTETLTHAGMLRYEVSAYSKPGFQCIHNLNYWQFGDYIGIGAGAHGKISSGNQINRQIKYRDPQLYIENAMAGQALSSQRTVSLEELPFEFMLGALRLKEGFSVDLFHERTGLDIQVIANQLKQSQALGLLQHSDAWIKPTTKGFDFLSDLLEFFLP